MEVTTMRVLIIVLCGVLVLGAPAAAQYMSGNDLVRLMKELEREQTENWFDAGVFSGFVIGVYDANQLAISRDGRISMIQVCSIVAEYLKQHPEYWHKPGYVLVIQALQDAFPGEIESTSPAGKMSGVHK
jgi:hypothetical protein